MGQKQTCQLTISQKSLPFLRVSLGESLFKEKICLFLSLQNEKKVCGWHSQPLSLQVAGLIRIWLGTSAGKFLWPLVHNRTCQSPMCTRLQGPRGSASDRVILRPGCYSSQAKASFSWACEACSPPGAVDEETGHKPQCSGLPVPGSIFLCSLFYIPQALPGEKISCSYSCICFVSPNWFLYTRALKQSWPLTSPLCHH